MSGHGEGLIVAWRLWKVKRPPEVSQNCRQDQEKGDPESRASWTAECHVFHQFQAPNGQEVRENILPQPDRTILAKTKSTESFLSEENSRREKSA